MQARRRTAVRAAASLVPAGRLDPGSSGRLSLTQAPSRTGVPLPLGDREAEHPARTGHRVSLALATTGRKLADPPGPGTAPPSRVTRSTPHRRTARSLAARRQGSSTVSTRSSSTRSSSTRERRVPATLVLDQGSLEIRDRRTVTGLSETVSTAKDTAASALGLAPPLAPVQAARQARASLGRERRPGDRPATRRRPASSPAQRDADQVLLAARTTPGPCSQVRLGKRRPVTSPRA
jgi:hypothetical protein